MNLYKEVKRDDLVLRVYYDESPRDPRGDDNLGTFNSWGRGYVEGDNHCYDCSGDLWKDLANRCGCDTEDEENVIEKQKEVVKNNFVILPVYFYDHSGITISTTPFSDIWDSGLLGYIYVSHEDIKKTYGEINPENLEQAKKALEGEIEEYSQYLAGDVFGFELVKQIKCEHCGVTHEEEMDSCWGFYGTNFKENGMADYVGNEELINLL